MSKATDASTTMAAVVHRDRFDNHALDVIQYKGRPCWVAREIGTALGYSQGGKRLVTNVTNDWSDEFVAGHDYEVLTGEDLASFKAVAEPGTESVPSFASSAIILYESGVHLACIKTDKPAGKRLRRHLVEDVLPKLARGETIEARAVLSSDPARDRAEHLLLRERRLADRERRLDRKAESDAIMAAVEDARAAGDTDPRVLRAFSIKARQRVTTVDLTPLLPPAPVDAAGAPSISPTEMAKRLNVSTQRIGLTLTALGVRGDSERCMAVINTAKKGAKTVTSYVYHSSVLDDVRAKLVEDGIAVASAE